MRTFSPKPPPLSGALSVILPDSEGTLFLRACLNPGLSGEQACRAWLNKEGETQNALKKESTKAFLPLFYHAVQAHGIELDNAFLTVLRTAALREELRTNTYRSICGDVFSVLADNEVSGLIVGGSAFGDVIYPHPALRHSHDIEILLNPRHLDLTLNLLRRLGFLLERETKPNEGNEIPLRHNSGLPLVLRSKLFHNPFYNAPISDPWTRSRTTDVNGIPVKVLSPPDALLYVCGRACFPQVRESYHWVVDAWFIIQSYRDLDWNLLLDIAKQSHLELPLSVTLNYLAKEIQAPIRPDFLARLHKRASRTTTIGRELALFGARSAVNGGFRNLLRKTQGWYGRALIVKWMLFPSPSYLRWVQQTELNWLLPLYYVDRPIRYTARRLRPRLRKISRQVGLLFAR